MLLAYIIKIILTTYLSSGIPSVSYTHLLVLQASPDTLSDIALGCIMERPKVVKNPKTGKYVMLFHLELRRKGYAAARTGFAVANQVKGPFRFVRSLRPNAGRWPADFRCV